MADIDQVYNSHGKKYEVHRRIVDSLDELRSGDHIAFHQQIQVLQGMGVSYWHHGIVEEIRSGTDELDVIEYSNTAKEFLNDNCPPPKNPKNIAVAKVVRGRYNFKNEVVHLMLHEVCLDSATVVNNARRELGSTLYCPLTNNCEHFAMRCKTGRSSSDQVNKIEETVNEQLRKALSSAAVAAVHLCKATPIDIVKSGVKVVSMKIILKTAFSVTTISTTKIVLTQRTEKFVSNAAALGVAYGASFEVIRALYDISYAYEDMKRGQISEEAFKKVAGRRAMTGFGSFVGSSIGMIVGKVATSNFSPFVGSLVGSVVGGLVGSLMANMVANAAL